MANEKPIAPPYRCNILFSTTAQNHVSWSENLWIDGGATTTAGARAIAVTMAGLRLAMALSNVTISRIRVSNAGTLYRGDGLLADLGVSNVGTYAGDAESPVTLPANAALLIRSQDSFSGQHVSDFMRGIPSNAFTVGGFYNPSTNFAIAMAAWKTALKANCNFVLAPHGVSPLPRVFGINSVQVFGIMRSRKSGQANPAFHARTV